jgi:hypothetical protein
LAEREGEERISTASTIQDDIWGLQTNLMYLLILQRQMKPIGLEILSLENYSVSVAAGNKR